MDNQEINKNHRKRLSKRGGLGVIISLLLVTAIIYIARHHKPSDGFMQTLPEVNEQGTKQWSDADKYLPGQIFEINTNQDTVIQTKGGLVIAVPANCFLDDNGNPASGSVELEVKEALDAASMMKAGLSTKSGNELLESAGMFYLNGRKDGKSLKINPLHGIYVQVPTDTVKNGMQAFEGKRMSDGTIDWINPKPLVHNLVPVDIHTLNFYPPLYLDSLAMWGQDVKNRYYTDSLYYSFAGFFGEQKTIKSNVPSDSVRLDTAYKPDAKYTLCGINPAKIKAIWSDEFQNTLISTKEFEARLSYIHKIGNEAILDLYVNNLDKNLSYIDSLAAEQLSGDFKTVFLSFAARGDGKVVIKSSLFEKLKAFFQKKSKLFTEAANKARKDYLEEQNKLDVIADSKINTDTLRSDKMRGDEYKENLKAACRQVGDPDSIGKVDKNG